MEDRTKIRIKEVKKRVWESRKKKIKIFFFTLLIFLVIAGMFKIKQLTVNFLWRSDIFKLKDIEVIPDKAKTYINSVIELEKDRNLLFLDIKSLREMIMKIPGIENCKIKKIYPSKIQIQITLRKPFVCIIKDEKKYFIDKSGVVLTENAGNKRCITVKGIKIEKQCVSQSDIWKIKVLENIEKWYNFYNIRRFFSIKEVNFISPNRIILETEKGEVVIKAKDINLQMEKLMNILEQQKLKKWEYIDLRFKNVYKK